MRRLGRTFFFAHSPCLDPAAFTAFRATMSSPASRHHSPVAAWALNFAFRPSGAVSFEADVPSGSQPAGPLWCYHDVRGSRPPTRNQSPSSPGREPSLGVKARYGFWDSGQALARSLTPCREAYRNRHGRSQRAKTIKDEPSWGRFFMLMRSPFLQSYPFLRRARLP
jgi:hypothetical protein